MKRKLSRIGGLGSNLCATVVSAFADSAGTPPQRPKTFQSSGKIDGNSVPEPVGFLTPFPTILPMS